MLIQSEVKQKIEQSEKSLYEIAKDAAISYSTLRRVVKDETWGTQLEVAQKVLNAVGYKLTIQSL